MPLGKQVTTNLTPNGVHHDNWGGPLSKIIAKDLNYAIADTVGQSGYVQFTSLPADVHSIDSIQVYLDGANLVGASLPKGSSAVIRSSISDDGGTIYNSYVEDTTVTTGFPDTYALTTRTTSDGSAPWTTSELNGIELFIQAHSAAAIGDGIHVDHCYIKVTYMTTPPPSYDSTIGRIVMEGGNTTLSGGNIILD